MKLFHSYLVLVWFHRLAAGLAEGDGTPHDVVVPPAVDKNNNAVDQACPEGSSVNETESTEDHVAVPERKQQAMENDESDDSLQEEPVVDEEEEPAEEGEEAEAWEGNDEEEEGEHEEWEGEEGEHNEEEDELIYKVWEETKFTLNDFSVAGVNLANFGRAPLFQLYHDFDISSYIRGDEDWEDILAYRNGLTRPSLSFYVDKVARKRWLPAMGFPQPKVHWMFYGEELTETGDLEEEIQAVHEALPTTGSFCAKPTHMSLTKGAWLVEHQEDGPTRFSLKGYALQEYGGRYNSLIVAKKLADSLHEGPDEIESWALKNVKPGLVVEERWASHTDPATPPHEFNMFTIWGKLWVGQWNTVEKENRWCDGFYYRNGTASADGFHPEGSTLPDWVPWDELVDIAERLGAHKDMFRTDIFVGRPVGADADSPLQIAVSESEIFPTTVFTSPELSREGARLWIAGYQLGIYEIIENTEVPPEFLETGKLSEYPAEED